MDRPEFDEHADRDAAASVGLNTPDEDEQESASSTAPTTADLIAEGFAAVKPLLASETYPDVDIFIEEEEDGSTPFECMYAVHFGHGGKHNNLHEVDLVQNIQTIDDARDVCHGIQALAKKHIRRTFK